MNDTGQNESDIRRTEALFRFGAALPPRNDFEQDLYREWHARDASRPTRTIFGRSPHLRGLTPDELRLLAEADVQAQAEYAAEHREPPAEAGLSPEAQEALRRNLNAIAEHDAIAQQAEQSFADYWGGEGPDWEAESARDDTPWPEAPWWDGEKMHDREPEMEAGL